jgi:hypothetical protein
MKLILNILLILGMSNALIAQTVPTEIEVLEQNYKRAVERATKSLNEQYKKELYKLLEKYSKQGNIKEVDKATELLKRLEPNADIIIAGTEWISESGTTFIFKDGGKGRRQFGADSTELFWKTIENRIILITTKKSEQGPTVLLYMNPTLGIYGDTPDKMTGAITKIK